MPKGLVGICPEYLDEHGQLTEPANARFERYAIVTWRREAYPGYFTHGDRTLTCTTDGSCGMEAGALMNGSYDWRDSAGRTWATHVYRHGCLSELTEYKGRTGAKVAYYRYADDAWLPTDGEKIQGIIYNERSGLEMRRRSWVLIDGTWTERASDKP